jgi:uncharacterized membrane protein
LPTTRIDAEREAMASDDRRAGDHAAGLIPAFARLREALLHNLWLLPAVGVVGAGLLSVALLAVDERLAADATGWYLFRGGPEGARSVLTAVASSIMTFTGVVFSVTVLVLQLASRQFSPRVLRTFLGDRATQACLAVFVGTFVYALLTLRSVRGEADGVQSFVPSLSVWFAVALATASVGTFVYFVHHISQAIRAVNVLARLGDETRGTIERLYPEGFGDEPPEKLAARPRSDPTLLVLQGGRSGVVIAVAEEQVWEAVTDADVTVALMPMVGDFVAAGSVLFEVWGDASRLDADALAGAVTIGRERTLYQDPAFGFRGIVDIAERALSPAFNDPTTAVQALDVLHDLLRRLCSRRFPDPVRVDGENRARVILPRPDFDACVRLALDEVRHFGSGSVQVVRRVRFLLEDLLQVAPPSRRAELRRQLHALDAAEPEAPRVTSHPAVLHRPSRQGHGP